MAEPQWAGLVTNASPYALPPGAATEQVNLSSSTPGQLTVRGGMQVVGASGEPIEDVVDICPFIIGGANAIIFLLEDGSVGQTTAISVGAATSAPTGLSLSPSSGQVASNYIGQFFSTSEEPPV